MFVVYCVLFVVACCLKFGFARCLCFVDVDCCSLLVARCLVFGAMCVVFDVLFVGCCLLVCVRGGLFVV